ncbi:MAG: hypothetical protein ABI615_12985 [Chthoniobacterales bacterium]
MNDNLKEQLKILDAHADSLLRIIREDELLNRPLTIAEALVIVGGPEMEASQVINSLVTYRFLLELPDRTLMVPKEVEAFLLFVYAGKRKKS